MALAKGFEEVLLFLEAVCKGREGVSDQLRDVSGKAGCRAVSLVIFPRQWRNSFAGSFLSQNKTINPGNLALLLYSDHVVLVEKNGLLVQISLL